MPGRESRGSNVQRIRAFFAAMLVHPNFDPVAVQVGPIAIRWYGLMYLVGFAHLVLAGADPRHARTMPDASA